MGILISKKDFQEQTVYKGSPLHRRSSYLRKIDAALAEINNEKKSRFFGLFENKGKPRSLKQQLGDLDILVADAVFAVNSSQLKDPKALRNLQDEVRKKISNIAGQESIAKINKSRQKSGR